VGGCGPNFEPRCLGPNGPNRELDAAGPWPMGIPMPWPFAFILESRIPLERISLGFFVCDTFLLHSTTIRGRFLADARHAKTTARVAPEKRALFWCHHRLRREPRGSFYRLSLRKVVLE
jgi:hypothetical protein